MAWYKYIDWPMFIGWVLVGIGTAYIAIAG